MSPENVDDIERVLLPFGSSATLEQVTETRRCTTPLCTNSVEVTQGVLRNSGTALDDHVLWPGVTICEACLIRKRVRQETINAEREKMDRALRELLPQEHSQIRLSAPPDPYEVIPKRLRSASWEIAIHHHRSVVAQLDEWRVDPDNIYIRGEQGRGKTQLAVALAKRRLDFAPQTIVVFENAPIFLDKIRRTFNNPERTDNLIDRAVNADVLIFDDFGAEAVSRWTLERAYVVLEERILAERPTIVTSQFGLKELAAHLMVGKDQDDPGRGKAVKRLVSRLAGEFRVLPELKGPDLRISGRRAK